MSVEGGTCSSDVVAVDDDRGFTVVELLLSAALSAVVVAMVWMWLSSTQEASDRIVGDLDEERGMSFTLEAALAEISDARPTALCLDPDPNSQNSPETTAANCTTEGDNWGYWPTVTSGTRSFVPGSPFHEADDDKLCFYALPDDETADPASSQTPWGSCLEQSGDMLLARTLEPDKQPVPNTNPQQYRDLLPLEAAVASNYSWSSGGTWTDRILGKIATVAFDYHDFDGGELTTPVSDGELDDIAMVTVTLTVGAAPDVKELSGTLAVRANSFSPCRNTTPRPKTPAATCPWLAKPATPTLTPGSGQLTVSWTTPSGVHAASYELQYKLSTATSWTDVSGSFTGTTAISLTAGTYDVRIRAKNSNDISEWSDAATGTVT